MPITEPAQVGALLLALDSYRGRPETRAALRLAPLVFVRPGELRTAQWAHVDFEAAQWRIPAHLMKMRRPHIVPLSRQAIEILRELRTWTGDGPLLFPMRLNRERPMSEFTINFALRSLGYRSDEITGHGFRSMACALLNERGWNTEAIERQLGHVEGNGVKAAYNYAQHLVSATGDDARMGRLPRRTSGPCASACVPGASRSASDIPHASLASTARPCVIRRRRPVGGHGHGRRTNVFRNPWRELSQPPQREC